VKRVGVGLRTAWSYSLGAVLGRIAGKFLGVALMGPLGAIVGEAMGEPVLASLGWLHARGEGHVSAKLPSPEPSPTSQIPNRA
jgi:hypothetical protein